MSSFSRRSILLVGLTALAGCGFSPAYAPDGAASRLQGRVQIDAPDDRAGYVLTRELEDRLGRSDTARFGLSHSIDVTESPIAISTDNVITRYNILGEVTFALRDLESGAVVTSGKVENFTAYSTSGTTVATRAAERDARDRLMSMLSDQIVTRLVAAERDLPE